MLPNGSSEEIPLGNRKNTILFQDMLISCSPDRAVARQVWAYCLQQFRVLGKG